MENVFREIRVVFDVCQGDNCVENVDDYFVQRTFKYYFADAILNPEA